MPRLKNADPRYRLHRASGQAIVTIGGRDHYLGKHGSQESKAKYHRLIGEWNVQGRPSTVVDPRQPSIGLTVGELVLRYWKHAEGYFRKNGRPTDECACIKAALRHVTELYHRTPAADFGPLALKAVRQRMIESGNSRGYINLQCQRIKKMFSWGVENELVPATVAHGLREVRGLAAGRSDARETDAVTPVDDQVVDLTIKQLRPVVAAMVQVQRLVGCRPEEICRMRPCDIDRSGDVWIYRPRVHKMMHKGKERRIVIGPRAQAILSPYLFDDDQPCFRAPRSRNGFCTRSYRDRTLYTSRSPAPSPHASHASQTANTPAG